jgi:hypothetical protein
MLRKTLKKKNNMPYIKNTKELKYHSFTMGRLEIESKNSYNKNFPIALSLPSKYISIPEAKFIQQKLDQILQGE